MIRSKARVEYTNGITPDGKRTELFTYLSDEMR